MIKFRKRIILLSNALVLVSSLLIAATNIPTVNAAGEPNPTPVFRFYKFRDGAHFFTNNESEKASVSTRPDVYRYEGVAFYSYPTPVSGTSAVYRFYNFKNGTHFYTNNASESNSLQVNAGHTYRYEGIAYYAQSLQVTDTTPVHRFYKFNQGIHFYTNNQAEATMLNNTASGTYRYEGMAYYLPKFLTFSGSGDQVTESFILPTTLAVFRSTYSGAYDNFSVWLKNANTGENVDLLANEVGTNFDISAPSGVGENRYIMQVSGASGSSWSITIEQPKVSAGYVSDFNGNGTKATQLFSMFAGGKTVSYSHDGSGYFGIWLWDGNGNRIDLIANEIGPASGGVYIAPNAGNYMFGVEADGNWAISIR